MKHLPFDATISTLDAETTGARRGNIGTQLSNIDTWYGNIGAREGDCGVGITPQMCNRVTNHGDMGTFS